MKLFALFAAALVAAASAQDSKCLVCTLVVTLLDQFGHGTNAPTAENPDTFCQGLGMCDGTCQLWPGNSWPGASPAGQTDGGVVDQRRRMLRAGTRRHPLVKPTATTGTEPAATGTSRFSHVDVDQLTTFLTHLGAAAAAKTAASGQAFGFYDTMTYIARVASAGPCDDALNITCDISRVFDTHLPLLDTDNDWHAPSPASFLTNGFRGGDWRGRDCNDNDATIYPGRANNTHGAEVDHNCNGIYGVNASTGVPYEEAFCSGANAPMGIAILGDSATAHFHLPPQYLNAAAFNLSGVLEAASNELDWPACSWGTGFRNTTDCPISYGVPMGSLYQRMRAANLCNHRDFQNLGVNGARTGSMAPLPTGIVNSLARNQRADAPLLTFHSLIGNDVCNGHPGLGSMTTPEEFYTNVMATLSYLDTVLPTGSHVAFLGLVDGRVLWDTTHTQIHPIGAPYPAIYDFLACNSMTPCWGWLNSNETWRNLTSERAANLTAVYDTIIANATFHNFDMYRVNMDWFALFANWTSHGYAAMDLIEPGDGFHPSQAGNQLLAEIIWEDLATNRPTWLPRVNPNNAAIAAIFGDQGGYD